MLKIFDKITCMIFSVLKSILNLLRKYLLKQNLRHFNNNILTLLKLKNYNKGKIRGNLKLKKTSKILLFVKTNFSIFYKNLSSKSLKIHNLSKFPLPLKGLLTNNARYNKKFYFKATALSTFFWFATYSYGIAKIQTQTQDEDFLAKNNINSSLSNVSANQINTNQVNSNEVQNQTPKENQQQPVPTNTEDDEYNHYPNDEQYFDTVYKMYDYQENSPYYTGQTRAETEQQNYDNGYNNEYKDLVQDSNQNPNQNLSNQQNYNKNAKRLNSRYNQGECGENRDCQDQEDMFYGLEMQDDDDWKSYDGLKDENIKIQQHKNNHGQEYQQQNQQHINPQDINNQEVEPTNDPQKQKPLSFLQKNNPLSTINLADNNNYNNSSDDNDNYLQPNRHSYPPRHHHHHYRNHPRHHNNNKYRQNHRPHHKHHDQKNQNDSYKNDYEDDMEEIVESEPQSKNLQITQKQNTYKYSYKILVENTQDNLISNEVVSDATYQSLNQNSQEDIKNEQKITVQDNDRDNKNQDQTNQNDTLQASKQNIIVGIEGNAAFASSDFLVKSNKSRGSRLVDNMQVRSSAFLNFEAVKEVTQDVKLAIKTQFDIGSNAYYDEDNNINLNKLFFQLKVKNGSTTEVGISKFAGENLRVDGSSFAKATGGIDGEIFRLFSNSYSSRISNANSSTNPSFIVVPRSPFYSGFANSSFLGNSGSFNINNGSTKLGNGDDFASVSYYTPRIGSTSGIGGIKLGLSFAPNTEDQQSKKNSNNTISALGTNGVGQSRFIVKNAYSGVLNYYKSFDSNRGSFVFSGSYEAGKIDTENTVTSALSTNASRKDISVFTAGFNLEYLGFIIGSSYSHWGKSMYYENYGSNLQGYNNYTADKGKNSYYYTSGIGYLFGPAGISLGLIKSRFMNNKFQNYVLSTDYEVINSKNFKAKHFVEISQFYFQPDSTIANQNLFNYRGYAILSGFRFAVN